MEPSSSSSSSLSISSEIVVAAVMFFFLIAAFVFFLYVYARYKWGSGSATHQGRIHLGVAADTTLATRTTGRGLDQEVLRTLPVLVFKKEKRTETVECSVCLSEIADGEKARLLPKCNHGFHIDCIDTWFRSHTTCPLCRNPVEVIPDVGHSSELRNLPTDVLFWGSQHHVSRNNIAAAGGTKENSEDDSSPSSSYSSSSSSSAVKMEGALVIDIPDRMAGEEAKSQAATPTLSKLKSLKRLLSRGKKAAAGSSRGGDGGEAQHATAEDRVRP